MAGTRGAAALVRGAPQLEYHFPSLPAALLGQAQPLSASGTPLNRLATPLRALIRRPPVCLPPETPVQAVAAHMRSERVSSVLLTEVDGRLVGVVTDRDLSTPPRSATV